MAWLVGKDKVPNKRECIASRCGNGINSPLLADVSLISSQLFDEVRTFTYMIHGSGIKSLAVDVLNFLATRTLVMCFGMAVE